MSTPRYNQQTLPSPAAVAEPVRSPLAALAGAAADVAMTVHAKLDERAKGVEAAALAGARRQLEERGLTLEMDLRKAAGPAGAGHVPSVQQKRQELVAEVWAAQPESVRKSERAKAQWDEIWNSANSDATRRATLWQREQETSFVADEVQKGLAGVTAAIEAAPDTSEAQLAAWRESLKQYTGVLGAETVRQIDEASARDITLAAVRGLAKAGRFNAAQGLIDSLGAQLGVEQRQAAGAAVEGEQRQAQGKAAEAIQLRIGRGEMSLDEIEAERAAGRIDDGQAAQLRGQIQGRTAEEIEKGVAARKLSAKDINAAEAAGQISTGQGNILRAQNAALIEKAQRDLEAERARKAAADSARMARNADVLRYQILDGNAGEAEVTLALQNRDISIGDANVLKVAARQGQGRRATVSGVLQMQAMGVPLNPYDGDTREALDMIWNDNGGAALFAQEMTTQEANGQPAVKVNAGTQAVLNVARTAGVIPPGAASALQGMAINGTDTQKQVAFDTVAQLADHYPGVASAAFPDGADRVMKDAVSWRLKVDAGIDPVSALRAVERENQAPADPVLRQRRADGLKAAAQMDAGVVNSILGEGRFLFWGSEPGLAPGAEAGALEMLREAFVTEYTRTGDALVASETAKKSLRTVLGATQVGGTARTMAYPPERYYAPQLSQQRPQWLSDQLVRGVQDLVDAGDGPVPPGMKVTVGDLMLVSDAKTAADVRGRQPPTYVVTFRGEPLDGRFQFDPADAQDEIRAEAQARMRAGERLAAVKRSGLFSDTEAKALAGGTFADRKAFDAALTGVSDQRMRVANRGAGPGPIPADKADTLWKQLQGLGGGATGGESR